MEETPFTPPPGVTDMRAIVLTWFLNFMQKQGAAMLVTFGFAVFFAWKTNRLEERLDACQTAKEDERITQVMNSSQSVVNAIETLIGKLEYEPRTVIKTRSK